MSWWHDLYEAHLTIGGHPITWREIVGNAFGFASAIGGMRRRVWAWPVGIIGNVLLFTVFIGVGLTHSQAGPMFGQAGRQVFFVLTSVYGWWAWRTRHQHGDGERGGGAAITPRWASASERLGLVIAWVAGVVVCQWLFSVIGAAWPAPRWYYWADAWIFVGSIIATYAMARGWTDFWLAWIGVDLVGVPLLVHSHFYPSAVLYAVYAGLVLYGFLVWLRVSRETPPGRDRHEQEVHA